MVILCFFLKISEKICKLSFFREKLLWLKFFFTFHHWELIITYSYHFNHRNSFYLILFSDLWVFSYANLVLGCSDSCCHAIQLQWVMKMEECPSLSQTLQPARRPSGIWALISVETFWKVWRVSYCRVNRPQCNSRANTAPCNPPKTKQALEEWGQALLVIAESKHAAQVSDRL